MKIEPESEALTPRWNGQLPSVPLLTLEPSTPGSVAWTAEVAFGGKAEFVKMLQLMVVGGGRTVEQRWRDAVSLQLRWDREGTEWNLNQLCAALDIGHGEMLAFVGQGVTAMNRHLAGLKAAQAAPDVIESAIMASRDMEKGGKDREMLLKIAGVIEPSGPGVVINNSNQVAVVNKEQLRTPLLKFREVQAEIDGAVRGEVVEGEIVQS